MATVLGVVNLLSALTPNAHWRGHVLVAGRADRRHARLPRAGGARVGRPARRRVLPAPPPARCVAGGARPALRSRDPRHRQGPRCRGGGAHGRGRGAALVGAGRVQREGRSGAAPLRRLARAGDRPGDDLPRRRRRRDRRAARRLRRTGSTRRSSCSPGSRASCTWATRAGTCRSRSACSGSLRSAPRPGSCSGRWPPRGRCPTRRCGTRSRSSCAATATTRSRSSSSAAISTTSSPTTAPRSSGTASRAG